MRHSAIAVFILAAMLLVPDSLAATNVGIVTGAGENGNGHVKRFPAFGAEDMSFFAFPGFPGEVRVAAGDVNGDGLADIIAGAGPGGVGGQVNVFDHSGSLLSSFMAFDATFTAGVHVAAGDLFGSGFASNLIVGADAGPSGGHVKVFGTTGVLASSFLAFPGFDGGVRVAAGDINGDGLDNLIVGAGPGGTGGHVKVYDGTGSLYMSFFAFDPSYTGGVFVAAGDITGNTIKDIIVGADSGTGGHIKIFDGLTGNLVSSFFAFSGFTGGVRVAAADLNGDGFDDIIAGAGVGAAGGHVKVFSGATLSELSSFLPYPPTFTGGVYVAGFIPEPGSAAALLAGLVPLLHRRRHPAVRRM